MRVLLALLLCLSAAHATPSAEEVTEKIHDAMQELIAGLKGEGDPARAAAASLDAEAAADELLAAMRAGNTANPGPQTNALLTSALLLRTAAALVTTALYALAHDDRPTLKAAVAAYGSVFACLTALVPATARPD